MYISIPPYECVDYRDDDTGGCCILFCCYRLPCLEISPPGSDPSTGFPADRLLFNRLAGIIVDIHHPAGSVCFRPLVICQRVTCLYVSAYPPPDKNNTIIAPSEASGGDGDCWILSVAAVYILVATNNNGI